MTLRKGEKTHLKEETMDRTMWRARFGRGFGPVVRQTTKLMNEYTAIQKEPTVALPCLRCTVVRC
jgi:hypothetical protein